MAGAVGTKHVPTIKMGAALSSVLEERLWDGKAQVGQGRPGGTPARGTAQPQLPC